ncbi:MAG: DHHW family protein [Phascolarctobacterium sp.]|nr:DHHW family protein [Phascolarctobacterium sp.]
MKKKNIPLAVGFCVLLAGISLSFFVLPKQEFSANEKRVLQSAPKFSWSRLVNGRLFSDVDSYISDHFSGRDFWVGLNAYARQTCGLNAAGEVYRGKDGWLMERPLEPGEIFDENVQALEMFAEKTELPMTLLSIPTTGYMMDDKLPGLHDAYPDAEMLETLRNICKDGMGWADVEDTLRDTSSGDTFYHTDHHWTSRGAYQAYQVLARMWELPAADAAEYEITTTEGFYGTAYSKSGLWTTEPDSMELWQDMTVQTQVTVFDENRPFLTEQDGMFFEEHLQEADKYPVFLDGNHARVTITTDAPSGRLLIVRDSFAHCLAPFFARHFQQIDLIDLRYFKEQTVSGLIEQNAYDRVLFVYGLASLAEERSIQWLE